MVSIPIYAPGIESNLCGIRKSILKREQGLVLPATSALNWYSSDLAKAAKEPRHG